MYTNANLELCASFSYFTKHNLFTFRALLHRTRWLKIVEVLQAFPDCPKACPKWTFLKTCLRWCDHKWAGPEPEDPEDTLMECYPKIQPTKAQKPRDFCHNCEAFEGFSILLKNSQLCLLTSSSIASMVKAWKSVKKQSVVTSVYPKTGWCDGMLLKKF